MKKNNPDITPSYEDIINLPHPISKTHPQMSLHNRAAQFAPFAALTGHEEAVKEEARLTEEQMELTEDEKQRLDEKLMYLAAVLQEQPELTITFFQPDERKAGGAYQVVTGYLKKIDDFRRCLILEGGQTIAISCIVELEGKIFSRMDME